MLKGAIIGLGNAGYLYDHNIDNKILTHFKAFSYSKKIELECVCELNQKNIEFFKSKNNIPIYSNYLEMLNNHKIDILSIVTPNENHVEVLKEVIKYKIKYVFCEKPISNNLDYLLEINDLYKKKNIPIYVNYFRKWDSVFNKIGNLIKKTKKENFLKIDINYSKGLIHTGTHYIDFLIDWLGYPTRWSQSIPIEKITEYDYTSSFTLYFNFKGKEIPVNMIGNKIVNNLDKISINLTNKKIEIIGARIVNYYDYIGETTKLIKTENTEFDKIILKIVDKICSQFNNKDIVFKDNFIQSYKVLEYAMEINKSLID